jgi:hypothetical protein
MKKLQKAKELESSDSILKYPNGDIDDFVLKEILVEAHYKRISGSGRILLTEHKRIRGTNPPEYENCHYSMTLEKLKELYKDIRGREFEPPQISEREHLERKERSYAKQAARRGYASAGD